MGVSLISFALPIVIVVTVNGQSDHRLKMLRLLVLSVALTTCLGQLDTRTIMEYLKDQNLNTLTTYLTATGLDKVLADPKSSAMTIFAPTEEAFNKLPSNIVFSLATNTTVLKKVLMDHVVNQVVLSQYVRDQDAKTNLNGEAMVFRVYDNGVKTVNGAKLSGNDISLANGVVHLIDDVILPTETNMGEYIAQHNSDFKDLFGLLVLGRLFGALETGGPFTMFAPTDAAFEDIQGSLPALINDRAVLSEVLKYHVITDTYWSVGLTDGMVLQTINGANLTVGVNQTGVTVNGAKVIQADIATSNGVIHVIDKVIILPSQ